MAVFFFDLIITGKSKSYCSLLRNYCIFEILAEKIPLPKKRPYPDWQFWPYFEIYSYISEKYNDMFDGLIYIKRITPRTPLKQIYFLADK